jgi:hypothetical protein
VNRVIALITAASLLVACAHERVGTQLSSIGNVDGDGAVLHAVKHALSNGEQECPLELLTPSNSARAADPTTQEIVSVKICRNPQNFSIQRKAVDADSLMIVARKVP